MKKILTFSLFVLGLALMIPNISKAQIAVCPVGYICIPSSEVITANCPQGYVCLQDPTQLPSAAVSNQISFYTVPQPNPFLASTSFGFKITAKNFPVYISDNLDSVNIVSSSTFKSLVGPLNVIPSPGILAGDIRGASQNQYIVPAGTTRSFFVYYSVSNVDTKSGVYQVQVPKIKYLMSPSSQNYKSMPIDFKLASVNLNPKCPNGYKQNSTDCLVIATTSMQLSTTLLDPVITQNIAYKYPLYIDVNVTAGEKDIYLSKNALNMIVNTSSPDTVLNILPAVDSSPSLLAGDTSDMYVVPSGAMRKFRIKGSMSSLTGNNLNFITINGLRYGNGNNAYNINAIYRLYPSVSTNPVKISKYPCSNGTEWDGNVCKVVTPTKSTKDTSSVWEALKSMF